MYRMRAVTSLRAQAIRCYDVRVDGFQRNTTRESGLDINYTHPVSNTEQKANIEALAIGRIGSKDYLFLLCDYDWLFIHTISATGLTQVA